MYATISQISNQRFVWILMGCLCFGIQAIGQADSDSEYKQYKTMADYSFEQGDYAKAKRLYEACVAMPKQTENDEVKQQIKACNEIEAAFKSLQNAVKNNPKELQTALKAFMDVRSFHRKPAYLQQQAFKIIETEADQWFKNGKFEEAAECYLAIYELSPLPNLSLKIEQANRNYTEKFKRALPQYERFQAKQKPSNAKLAPPKQLSNQQEYDQYRTAADASFGEGNYDLARRKYNAALQVVGFENDKYAQNQLLKSTKLIQLQKAASSAKGNTGAMLLNAREALAQNPNDAKLKADLGKAAEAVGNEMFEKALFADAKRYYQEAESYGALGMETKIKETETKIKEKRANVQPNPVEELSKEQKRKKQTQQRPIKQSESPKDNIAVPQTEKNRERQGLDKTVKLPKPLTAKQLERQRKAAERLALRQQKQAAREAKTKRPNKEKVLRSQIPKQQKSFDKTIVGVAITGGIGIGLPVLHNGSNAVVAKKTATLEGGIQGILFPNGKLSPMIGVNYLTTNFQSFSASDIPLERFEFDLLQVPIGLRFNHSLAEGTWRAHLHAGATLNFPQKFSYSNYAMDINTTDMTMISKQKVGFYGGLGLSRKLSERRSVSLLLNYQRTDNLLNLDYNDPAMNRSRASMVFQSLSIQLVFKVF